MGVVSITDALAPLVGWRQRKANWPRRWHLKEEVKLGFERLSDSHDHCQSKLIALIVP